MSTRLPGSEGSPREIGADEGDEAPQGRPLLGRAPRFGKRPFGWEDDPGEEMTDSGRREELTDLSG